MKKKMLFFINPNAGHAEIRGSLMEVLQVFSAGGNDVTVHPTTAPKDLTQKIVEDGAQYDLVVCTGGDGTLNEAVSGLMQLNESERPPLGYIPGGTVNDVASTLGLSKTPITAARDIVCGQEFLMDVGEFNEERWFCYVAAFGLFTDVSYETPQEDKRALGRLAYLLAGVNALADVKPIRAQVTCEGQTFECELIDGLVCSTTSVGGFKLGQGNLGIALDDGKSEVVLVKNIRNLSDFNKVAAHLLRREFQNDSFIWRQTGEVRFCFDSPVSWTLDGEYGGTHQEVQIKIHRKALKILVPK